MLIALPTSRPRFRGRFRCVAHFTPKCNRVFAAGSRPQKRGHYAAQNLGPPGGPQTGVMSFFPIPPGMRDTSAHTSRAHAIRSPQKQQARLMKVSVHRSSCIGGRCETSPAPWLSANLRCQPPSLAHVAERVDILSTTQISANLCVIDRKTLPKEG